MAMDSKMEAILKRCTSVEAIKCLSNEEKEILRNQAVPDNHNNTNNKFSNEEMQDPTNQFEFTLYILNKYYVLLTRGIEGIRLGFWDGDNSFESIWKRHWIFNNVLFQIISLLNVYIKVQGGLNSECINR